MRPARPSHLFFAATMIGIGILSFAKGDLTAIWMGVPKGAPAREAIAYLCALVSLASGVGLLWRRTAAAAAGGLLVYLALWMLVFRLPRLLGAPASSGLWWSWGETAVMLAAAWALYARPADGRGARRANFAAGDKGLRAARVFYGLGLVPFGIAHFTYFQRTVSLVPGWLPWHEAWAYFTGCAFIVAGAAIAIGVCARLAASLSLLQVALFTLLVWVPIIAAGPKPSDWIEFVDSCTLTAAAWVIADSYRGMRWLGAGRR